MLLLGAALVWDTFSVELAALENRLHGTRLFSRELRKRSLGSAVLGAALRFSPTECVQHMLGIVFCGPRTLAVPPWGVVWFSMSRAFQYGP